MSLTPDQSSTLLSLNGIWAEVSRSLPLPIRNNGIDCIDEIGNDFVIFLHNNEKWKVSISTKTVFQLEKKNL